MQLRNLLPWRFRSINNYQFTKANWMFRKVLQTPALGCAPESDTEVHALACARDLNMLLLSAKSFLVHCPNVRLVVHDDGSLTRHHEGLLRNHLPHVKFVARSEADTAMRRALPPSVFTARQENVFLIKFFDVNYFSRARRTILLDSDIIFTAPPTEILDWVRSDSTSSFYNADPEPNTVRTLHGPNVALRMPHFNAGFMGYHGHFAIETLVDLCMRLGYYREDQTLFAYLLSERAPLQLPSDRYHVYVGMPLPPLVCMVHFVSTHRFRNGAYVALAQKTIARLQEMAS